MIYLQYDARDEHPKPYVLLYTALEPMPHEERKKEHYATFDLAMTAMKVGHAVAGLDMPWTWEEAELACYSMTINDGGEHTLADRGDDVLYHDVQLQVKDPKWGDGHIDTPIELENLNLDDARNLVSMLEQLTGLICDEQGG